MVIELSMTHQKLKIDAQQLVQKVNSFCAPEIPQILLERVIVEGVELIVISIPPSPYVHETKKRLDPKTGSVDENNVLRHVKSSTSYSEHCCFFRVQEQINIASMIQRKALENDKKVDLLLVKHCFKQEIIKNLDLLFEKREEGPGFSNWLVGYYLIKDHFLQKFSLYSEVKRSDLELLRGIFLNLYGKNFSISNLFLLEMIKSGGFSYIDLTLSDEKREKLFELLLKLNKQIEYLKEPIDITDQLIQIEKDLESPSGDSIRLKTSSYFRIYLFLEAFHQFQKYSMALLMLIGGDFELFDMINLRETISGGIDLSQSPSETFYFKWAKEFFLRA